MIWHCEDCRMLGFYWDKTPKEVRDEHMKTCTGASIPDATGNDTDILPERQYWPEGAEQ